ncbi:MAG: DnaJ domain-containing protein [Synechococcales bacterium]|nr:DnaJ domain-containing protein [Synechococcales bacterium]
MTESNHYETLELHPQASQAEIKQAYRRLAKIFHPDTNQSTADHDRIAGINAAYEVLSDPQKRRTYDVRLKYAGFEGGGDRQVRTKAAQTSHRQRRTTGQRTDAELNQWLQEVYRPVSRWLSEILNPLEDEIDQLAADPFDDELIEAFQEYLSDCRDRLELAQVSFRSYPNPINVAAAASNLYYCLNQIGDGIEELERFVYSYDEHYLHTGHELFRIARRLKREAQDAVRTLV